ncbi:polysaccharide deacetylase [Mesorhizobium sp.]|uniref:polysaccharide deacetylase family protein n=1 Tax=Mesorhizobium sp. TaxID=1871066 RepID=UPI0025FA57C9|nr:polysaccharide deacetylase [Mesorhizobium sp.]
MPRHIACLTFDFDVWSVFTAWGMTTPTPVSRGEFGLVGAERLLQLTKKYGIKSTWFVPGVVIDTYPEICGRLVEAGHEVAHHGYSHVAPGKMDPKREEAEMVRARESIRRLVGRYPRGYRSPAWDLSTVTIDLLLKYGFDYESSMMGNDHHPYFARQGDKPTVDQPFVFGKPTRLVEMPISWTLDDFPHMEFVTFPNQVFPGLQSMATVLEHWTTDFDYMKETTDWGVLTYTCHPFVIGRGHRIRMLEKLIQHIGAAGGEFLTMGEAADAFLEMQQ